MNDNTARRRRRGALAAALLAPVLLAGCNLTPQRAETDSRPDSSTASTPAPATTSPGSGRAPVAGAPSGSPAPAPRGSGDAAAGPQVLNIEQRHPNGSVLRLTSLTVEPDAIRLAIQVVNGADWEVGLAPGGAVVSLYDNLGGRYEFLKPVNNPDLKIPQRGTLSGELVYFGVLNPDADSLRLQTNATKYDDPGTIYDPATELPKNYSPHFSVEIPLDR